MRNVLIKRWIPIEYERTEQGHQTRKVGTGCYSKEYEQPGKFHEWGLNLSEGDNTVASYTVGIVELPSGEIITIDPTHIKFTE